MLGGTVTGACEGQWWWSMVQSVSGSCWAQLLRVLLLLFVFLVAWVSSPRARVFNYGSVNLCTAWKQVGVQVLLSTAAH